MLNVNTLFVFYSKKSGRGESGRVGLVYRRYVGRGTFAS